MHSFSQDENHLRIEQETLRTQWDETGSLRVSLRYQQAQSQWNEDVFTDTVELHVHAFVVFGDVQFRPEEKRLRI